ncbi:MAG TPA: asparagine synthase (glutamine-hydrolyzing) [Fulvivirga sp.]|nr:asparagine synthase (glutamine-hydrolyzing) [Fulvivirga sp.]
MCGILGSVGRIEVGRFKVALEKQAYRGPDAEGYYQNDIVQLGHRRLSIIDLHDRSNQPMLSANKSTVIVFNGEIYNHKELRSRLNQPFCTNSDTEVILAAYESWGIEKTLQKLRGMFAFAIYDLQKGLIFLARDHVGKKPLYIGENDNGFHFSSTFNSLFCFFDAKPTIRQSSVHDFFVRSYIAAPQTIYNEIQAIQPGNLLTYSVNSNKIINVKRFWQLQRQPIQERVKKKVLLSRLKELLIEVVKKRLLADVPIGLFLSGGIDSSLVAAICTKELNYPLKTYSMGFSNPQLDESGTAKRIASILGTDHTTISTQEHGFKEIKWIVNKFGQPFGDHSAIPTSIMASKASNHIKVALTGDGGDEGFGGYHTHLALKVAQRMGKTFVYKHGRLIFRQLEPWNKKVKWINLINSSNKGYYVSDLMGRKGFRNQLQNLFNNSPDILQIDKTELDYWNSLEGISWLNKGILLDFETILPNALLVKTDVSTMAHGLEARSPFLDIDLLQFGLNTPDDLKINGVTTKYILRTLLAEYLPSDIIKLPKKGFSFDLKKFIHENFNQLRTFILDQNWKNVEMLNKQYVENTFLNFPSVNSMSFNQIWLILVFFIWKEQYDNEI